VTRVNDVLAALLLATALYHAGRLVSARRSPTVDVTHLLMGLVMAVMLLRPIGTESAAALAAFFIMTGGAFGWELARTRRWPPVQNLVLCLAMAYMLAALGQGAMPAMAVPVTLGRQPVLPLALAAATTGVAVLTVAALARAVGRSDLRALPALSCKATMCLAMAYGLLAAA
jgi:hypothetical protein